MRIERPDLQAALLDFATAGHGLVVGRPGVGKSYSLVQLTRSLDDQGVPYLLLAVDELGDATEEDLRTSLGYPGTFAEQLEAVFLSSPAGGVVIFDGFDAARNASVRNRLLLLIRSALRRAPSNWSILVSVRSYDAAKSPSLLEMFGSRPTGTPERFSQVGIQVRHFLVPELTEVEVNSAVEQIPGLASVYSVAGDGLRRLVMVPLNLWLIDRVLRRSPDSTEVGALNSEIQLLDLFWSRHISNVPNADSRLAVLQRTTTLLVRNRRLTVSKSDVFTPGFDEAWRDLFSSEVLVEAGPGQASMGFSHNTLFDYAVTLLIISPVPSGLVEFLTEDISRPLFLRPSLVYYFARLWTSDQPALWKSYLHLLQVPDVPVRLVGRLIPPYIIARECRNSEDLGPLLEALQNDEDLGSGAMLRVLQALRFAEPYDTTPWVTFAPQAAQHLNERFAWELATLLARLLEMDDPASSVETVPLLGRAARSMFEWAWRKRTSGSESWFDGLAATLVTPLVLKTFGTDPTASERIVRRILGLLSERSFSIRYFYSLADGIEHIVPWVPELVGDIYRQIFSHREECAEQTQMGGVVIPLRSNRRQDFELCYYVLGKAFPELLRVAPAVAIPVAIDTLNEFLIAERIRPYLHEGKSEFDRVQVFEFLGAERRYLPDSSLSWSHLSRDEVEEMSQAVLNWLTVDESTIEPARVVSLMASHALTAAAWGLLLRLGAALPARYASLLFGLSVARPLQLGDDTVFDLCELIKRGAEYWTSGQRSELESSLLSLVPSLSTGESDEVSDRHAARVRDQLLACIPRGLLATTEAQQRLEELTAAGPLPEPRPPLPISAYSRIYTEDDWLVERGVDITQPENVAIREVRDSIKEFAEKWFNQKPTEEDIVAFLPKLRLAYEQLSAARKNPDSHPDVVAAGWTKLAAAAHTIARARAPLGSPPRRLVEDILFDASTFPEGRLQPDADRLYTHASWSPTPRTEAIQGLCWLASVEGDVRPATAVKDFSASGDPAERFLAVDSARLFARTAAEVFWVLLSDRVARESNVVVAGAALRAIALSGERGAKALNLVRAQIARWIESEADELQRSVADWLVFLAVYRDDEWAWSTLRESLENLPARTELLQHVTFYAINIVTPGSSSEPDQDAVVGRAVAWIIETLKSLRARVATSRLEVTKVEPDSQVAAFVGNIHRMVDEIVARAYFNLRRSGEAGQQEVAPTPEQLRRYYTTIRPVLDEVLSFSGSSGAAAMVAGTAHRFMELLNAVIDVNPAEVVGMAHAVAAAGSHAGFHFDSLAVGEVVRLVETVLTDYRDEVAEGKPLDDLLHLLDIFADVGWPDALRLVWRLDEVFR